MSMKISLNVNNFNNLMCYNLMLNKSINSDTLPLIFNQNGDASFNLKLF